MIVSPPDFGYVYLSTQLTPTPGPSESLMHWVLVLVGGLVVLTAVLVVVIIYMLKKFKQY